MSDDREKQLLLRASRMGTIFENGYCIICKHPENDHYFGGCNYTDPYIICVPSNNNCKCVCRCRGQRQLVIARMPPGYMD